MTFLSISALLFTILVSPFGTYVVSGQYFEVTTGGEFCEIDNDGCVTDGHDEYGSNERCTIQLLANGKITATEFNTEHNYDYLTIGTSKYMGDGDGPQNVDVTTGDELSWFSDGSVSKGGWTICFTPAPTSPPTPPTPPPIPLTSFSTPVSNHEPRAGKGGNCTLLACDGGLYCVQEEIYIKKIGKVNGPNKMCVECLSDYDCPSSISCTNPLTPIAMCDWGAQKTFPGIDNIRKGYNGLKSDPFLYKDSMDPGWETEGYIFDYNYMINAGSFTFNDELYDVPYGHFVDVEESCSFNMKSTMISSAEDFDTEVTARVEKETEDSEVAGAGRAYYSNSNSKKETTSTTQATCNQYIIELDMKKLHLMKLDAHFIAFLKSQKSKVQFNYKALFDKKGTHFVKKAWLGSKFGMTNTITDENKKKVAGLEADFSTSSEKAAGGTFKAGGSVSTDVAESLAEHSDSMNTFSIGASNIASIEDWAEASKKNPEIVRMKVGGVCTLLAKFPQYVEGTAFNENECKKEVRAYTNVNLCYDITTKTCDDGTTGNAGTNSELYLSIYGEYANRPMNIIGIYLNDKVSAIDAFEKGDTDTLRVCGEINVGTIKEIGIRGDGDTWKPSWVGINGQIFNYNCSPIDKREVKAYPSKSLKTYTITIQTCSMLGAGTDASIHLYLYGDSPEKALNGEYLNNLIDGDAFENGSSHTIDLRDKPDIGILTKIGVTASFDDGWMPLNINVAYPQGEGDNVENLSTTFTFDCPVVWSTQVNATKDNN